MPTLDHNSRFFQTDLVSTVLPDGTTAETYGPWVAPAFIAGRLDKADIGSYRVETGLEGRPDLIARKLYGTPFLDWVLIAFNGADDVLNWPAAGIVIGYPSASVVLAEIG